MRPSYAGKRQGKFLSQITINERVVVELFENPTTEGNLDIWISQDKGEDLSYVGLKLATLNRICSIANGNIETVQVLYGKKDE